MNIDELLTANGFERVSHPTRGIYNRGNEKVQVFAPTADGVPHWIHHSDVTDMSATTTGGRGAVQLAAWLSGHANDNPVSPGTMTDEELDRMPWTSSFMTDVEFREWFATRKAAAAAIDIETCELGAWYALDADPYGVGPELPKEMQQVGTNRFVRSPESRGWVWEGDLPGEKIRALYARLERDQRAHMRE
jgi:hypothetical protein